MKIHQFHSFLLLVLIEVYHALNKVDQIWIKKKLNLSRLHCVLHIKLVIQTMTHININYKFRIYVYMSIQIYRASARSLSQPITSGILISLVYMIYMILMNIHDVILIPVPVDSQSPCSPPVQYGQYFVPTHSGLLVPQSPFHCCSPGLHLLCVKNI